MSQPAYQPLDPDIIETLKAARNQILTATANPLKVNPVPSRPPQAARPSNEVKDKQKVNFAEEFVQKLSSLEQEKTAVDEEITKVEKLWSNLAEKKKQLENKRDELIKVKDKLKELDKEMSAVLKSQ